jgi:hypothetical protein
MTENQRFEYGTFPNGGKFRVRPVSLGIRKRVLHKHKGEDPEYIAIQQVQQCLQCEAQAGSGVWRNLTDIEFDNLDPESIQAVTDALRRFQPTADQLSSLSAELLELLPGDAPLEVVQFLERFVQPESPNA